MAAIPYIAEVAALIGDPARANMLSALKDDGLLSATELAHVAGVAPNTASGHLAKLSAARLVIATRQGRYRYYALACHEVADALEALEALAAKAAPRRRPKDPGDDAIRYARSCYDHLAGTLGVGLTEALLRRGYLKRADGGFAVTRMGAAAFDALGIDLAALAAGRRSLLRACPDWSERAPHLGGALGAALFTRFRELGWLRRRSDSRALTVTAKGRTALRRRFGLAC